MGEKTEIVTRKYSSLTDKAKNGNYRWSKDEWSQFRKQVSGGRDIPAVLAGGRASMFGFARDDYEEMTPSDVRSKIFNDDIEDLRKLSRDYFKISGFYARTLVHFATLLKFQNYISPVPKTPDFNSEEVRESYYEALHFMGSSNFEKQSQYIMLNILIEGAYYALIHENSEAGGLLFQQLPSNYCKSTSQTLDGVGRVDFDVTYFDEIQDDEEREMFLERMPSVIQQGYADYESGKEKAELTLADVGGGVGTQEYWVTLDITEGVAFLAPEERPPLLSIIPTVVNLDIYRDMELSRDEAELHRLLVQKVPMGKDGELLLELPEIQELHDSVASMLYDTPNIDVITTFADITAPAIKDTRQVNKDNIEKVEASAYTEAGVSKDIFSPNSSLSVKISLENDLSYAQWLAQPIVDWFRVYIRQTYSGTTYDMSFELLPVTIYNQKDMVELYRTNATYGAPHSLMVIASGVPQYKLEGLLRLEQEVMGLGELMLPLQSSNTMSGNSNGSSGSGDPANKGGRPELPLEEKSDKTIQNIDSEGGGS